MKNDGKKDRLRPLARRPPIPRGHTINSYRREKEQKGAWRKEWEKEKSEGKEGLF